MRRKSNEGEVRVTFEMDEYERDVRTKIGRVRRLVHIHSVLYYKFNRDVIKDHIWDDLSESIKWFNNEHPVWSSESYRQDLFGDWTGDTGMHLPVDEYVVGVIRGVFKINI